MQPTDELPGVRAQIRALVRRTSRLHRQFWCIAVVVVLADIAVVVDYLRLLRDPGLGRLLAWIAMLGVMVVSVVLGVMVRRQLEQVRLATRRILAGFLTRR